MAHTFVNPSSSAPWAGGNRVMAKLIRNFHYRHERISDLRDLDRL